DLLNLLSVHEIDPSNDLGVALDELLMEDLRVVASNMITHASHEETGVNAVNVRNDPTVHLNIATATLLLSDLADKLGDLLEVLLRNLYRLNDERLTHILIEIHFLSFIVMAFELRRFKILDQRKITISHLELL